MLSPAETSAAMYIDENPRHWKLQVFYYNPENPRLFVRKRTRLGVTLNFARPITWIAGAGLLLAAIYFAIANN